MVGYINYIKDINNEIKLPLTVDKGVLSTASNGTIADDIADIRSQISNIGSTDTKYEDLYIGVLVNAYNTTASISGTTQDVISPSTTYVTMNDMLQIPYVNMDLYIKLPEDIRVQIKSNDSPGAGGVLSGYYSNGSTYTFSNNSRLFRVQFSKTNLSTLSVDTINNYINNGDIRLYFDKRETTTIYQRNIEQYNKIVTSTMVQDSTGRSTINNFPVIAHISDLHSDALQLKNFYDFCKYIKVDAALVTGDLAGNTLKSGAAFMYDLSPDNIKTFCCTGNHDTSAASSSSEVYDGFTKNMAEKYNYNITSGTNYYYYDDTNRKLRYIVLDVYDGGNSKTGGSYARIGSTQINWFISTLGSTPANYGVFVLSHCQETALKTGTDTTFIQSIRPFYSFLEGMSGNPITKIIDAFIGKTSASGTYTQRANLASSTTETISWSCNFSSLASGVEFLAYVNGHQHSDGIGYASSATYNQLILNICIGSNSYGAVYNGWAHITDLPRAEIGITQDSFNVYIVNRTTKKIRVVRIGSHTLKDFTERSTAEYSYV